MLGLFLLSFDESFCHPIIAKYRPRTDADLIQVQIISRHGARTPLHKSVRIPNVWECHNSESTSHSHNFSRALHVSVSHGKSVFLGNCHFGQLLGKGVAELKKLGQYLRNVYVDQLKFLPSKFDPSICKFRSTNTIRTIHSQISIFTGLYPGNYSLTIETADKKYDPWRRTSGICPRFHKIYKELMGGSEWVASGLQNDDLMNSLSKSLVTKWSSTNDAMTSTLCQGFDLPPEVDAKVVDEAIALKARQMQFIYSHDQIFPLFSSFPAAEILNAMLSRVNGKSRTRFVHWSAHDGNILSLLGYLGYSDGKWPPYGSFIAIELYRFRKIQQFFVQFRYNGRLMRIPRFSYSRVIPLDDFAKFVRNYMPRLVEDCEFNSTDFNIKDLFTSA